MSSNDNNNNTATTTTHHKCPVCNGPADNRCSRCKSMFYCSKEHQRQHWKTHKREQCDDAYRADQYTLHKAEFDRIVQKYGLNSEEKSSQIADFLTTTGTTNAGNDSADDGNLNRQVSAAEFADKFGTTPEEAVVFLEWIKVGVNFKQQAMDVANKSGLGDPGGTAGGGTGGDAT